MLYNAVLGLALLAAPAVQAGMYAQPVINLDAKTWKQALSVEHAAMVAFVAPWCGHCKNLGPEFTAAASSLSPLIPFYAVDCDDNANKPLCAEYQIKGFPTIKAFPRALKGPARDYQGERKRGALVDYAKGLVPDKVKKLRIEEGASGDGVVQKFLSEKPELPHALLVHPSAPSIPFLWKVLAHRFAAKVHMAYIRDTTSHAILSALGTYDPADTSRDTVRILYWPTGASKAGLVQYDGANKFNPVLEFLQSQLGGSPMPDHSKQQEPLKAESGGAEAARKAEQAAAEASAAAAAAAEKRAKQQAKMDEAERRDKARREKLEAASKSASSDSTEEAPSPAEAPDPVPEEGVEEESLENPTSLEDSAEDPVPAQSEAVEAEATATTPAHEEL